ncbi:MAG: hypothetical protein RL456_267 [Pseudomonadota bacterium]|jgi:uncharacterized protein YgbK (DUF1537 family)
MTRAALRLLADDLTGALDSAAAFGAGVPVHLDRPGAVDEGVAVQVVATATRDVPADELPGLLGPCVSWLAGAGLAFKKVDSLLRGNTLAEVRWLAAAGGFRRVVFAPAFPAQGRFTLGGRLAVAPVGGSAEQAEARGVDLREALQASGWPAGCTLALPEVRSQADLARLVAGPARRETDAGPTLWCGSAGLAGAFRGRGPLPDPPPPGEGARPDEDGPVWVIGASHQPVTRRQWARAMAAHPDAVTVRHGDAAEFDQALTRLRDASARPALALLDLSPLTPLTPPEAAALLHAQVQRLAALPQGPARLLVLGGDTARALVRATGVDHLVSGQPVRPGWGQARWCGGGWDGLRMDGRSGAFGGDDDLLAALRGR